MKEDEPSMIDLLYGPDPMLRSMKREGLTPAKLAKDMKRGLEAVQTKTIKVKGDIAKAPKGYRVVAKSISKVLDKNGVVHDFVKETVLQWDEVYHDERTRNRIDAEGLAGLRRPEKHEVEHRGRFTLVIEGLHDPESDPGDADPV